MMVSAPDTPYGAAFIQFCQLLAWRPLDLTRLHESFASLAAVAARDHPEMPWPTVMRTGNGQTILFTVEALLAEKSESFAKTLSVSDDIIRDLLVRWEGVRAKEVVAGWQGAGFQLHLTKKVRVGPKSTRTQPSGSLCVSCSWKLGQEQRVVCTSSDNAQHIEASLRGLKGILLLSSNLGLDGLLLLKWKNGFWLEIQPDGWLISADYLLDFGWDDQQLFVYRRFDGSFVAYEQEYDVDGENINQTV
jgi:hypothetical protein